MEYQGYVRTPPINDAILTAGYFEGISGAERPKVGNLVRGNPPMFLPYCLPFGLWQIHLRLIRGKLRSPLCGRSEERFVFGIGMAKLISPRAI